MKLKLNKKSVKNLSLDSQVLPNNMTPNVAGGDSANICEGTSGATYTTATCLSQYPCSGATVDTNPHCAPREDTAHWDGC